MIVNLLIIGGFAFLCMFIGYLISEFIEAYKIKNEAKKIKNKDNIREKFEEYLKDKNK